MIPHSQRARIVRADPDGNFLRFVVRVQVHNAPQRMSAVGLQLRIYQRPALLTQDGFHLGGEALGALLCGVAQAGAQKTGLGPQR